MTQSEGIALDDVSVTIGMPVDNPIPHRTVMALCETFQTCARMGIRLEIAMEVCGVIQIGRDCVLDDFLRNGTQKLFWIDSDMIWSAADFIRLLALSMKFDVVGAAYPAKVAGPTTFYAQMDEGGEVNELGLMEAKGIGLGFTIVDRSVAEQLAAKAPRVKDDISGREMGAVFRVDIFNGHRRTEDMAFFADIRELGHKVWIDPSIRLGHIGESVWVGRLTDAFAPEAFEPAAQNPFTAAA